MADPVDGMSAGEIPVIVDPNDVAPTLPPEFDNGDEPDDDDEGDHP